MTVEYTRDDILQTGGLQSAAARCLSFRPCAIGLYANLHVVANFIIQVEAHVVAAVVVVNLQTFLVHDADRGIEVHLVRTSGCRYRVVLDGTGAEHFIKLVGVGEEDGVYHAHGKPLFGRSRAEVGRVVAGSRCTHMHGQRAAVVGHVVVEFHGAGPCVGAVVVHFRLALFQSALGSDKDNAIGSTRTVYGRRSRIFQHGDAFDVVHVDAVDVYVGHAIHHNQRV